MFNIDSEEAFREWHYLFCFVTHNIYVTHDVEEAIQCIWRIRSKAPPLEENDCDDRYFELHKNIPQFMRIVNFIDIFWMKATKL